MRDKIRVVLADDHAVVREGIRRFLEEAGDIEVVAEAGDGRAFSITVPWPGETAAESYCIRSLRRP